MPVALSKLDPNLVQEKLAAKKEELIRLKKPINVAELTKEINNAMVCQYVIARIIIPGFTNDFDFHIAFSPMTSDVVNPDSQLLDMQMEKPLALDPFEIIYHKKAR
jgi:hypothetical protein